MCYDFYAITQSGYKKLNKCTMHPYCNCACEDDGKLNYASCLELVEFTEDNLKVLEIELDNDPLEEKSAKKPKLIFPKDTFLNNKNKPISSIDFTCEHSILSTQIEVKVLKKISSDSYFIGDSTETCKLKVDSNLTSLEEGKCYKILFKDTIFEENCIVVTDDTDVSELYGIHVIVPYNIAMKIEEHMIKPKVRNHCFG